MQQPHHIIRTIFLIILSTVIINLHSSAQTEQPLSEGFPATCIPENPSEIAIGRFIADGDTLPTDNFDADTADFIVTVSCFGAQVRRWDIEIRSPELQNFETAPLPDYSSSRDLQVNRFESTRDAVETNDIFTITWDVTDVNEICLGFGVPYEPLRQSAFLFCHPDGSHGLRVPAKGQVQIKVTNDRVARFRTQLGLTNIIGFFSDELFTTVNPICAIEHTLNPPVVYGYDGSRVGEWGFGCPTTQVQSASASYQAFENGFMLWFEGHIFAVQTSTNAPDGSSVYQNAYYYRDNWANENISYEGDVPNDMLVPQRGFGWVWSNYPDRQRGLGFAISDEIAYTANIQFYGIGKMVISLPDGEWLGVQPVTGGGANAPRDTYYFGLTRITSDETSTISETPQTNICEEQVRMVWIAIDQTNTTDEGIYPTDLMLFDGTSTRLINNDLVGAYSQPQVSENLVVWRGVENDIVYLYVFDGTAIEPITLESTLLTDEFTLSGNRVAYLAHVNNNRQVFLWENGTTTQLTNTADMKQNLTMDGEMIVWEGASVDADIFYWNGNEVLQLTDDDVPDRHPVVDGNWILWERGDGLSESQIMFWDGTTIRQLTDDNARDAHIHTDGDRIVWMKSYADRDENDIVLWDDINGTQIINTGEIAVEPKVSGSQIIWTTARDVSKLFMWQDNIITQLSTDGNSVFYHQLLNGHLAYSQFTENNIYDVFYSDDDTTRQLTQTSASEEAIDLWVSDNCEDDQSSPTTPVSATPIPTVPPTTPTPFPTICQDALPSRVGVGDIAFVTISPEGEERVDLRVRDSAGGDRIGSMAEGTQFNVIGGPECADGLTWWQIQTLDGSLTGWSAEGIAPDDYFIQPER